MAASRCTLPACLRIRHHLLETHQPSSLPAAKAPATLNALQRRSVYHIAQYGTDCYSEFASFPQEADGLDRRCIDTRFLAQNANAPGCVCSLGALYLVVAGYPHNERSLWSVLRTDCTNCEGALGAEVSDQLIGDRALPSRLDGAPNDKCAQRALEFLTATGLRYRMTVLLCLFRNV
jgi:hypothetical protein